MDRRRFLLTSLAGVLAAPLVADAQQLGKVYRVGILIPGEPAPSDRVTISVLVPAALRAEEAAAPLGVTLVVVAVRSADYASAFDRIVSERAQALLVFSSPLLHRDQSRIIELAAKHRLPAIYQWREHAEEGGLMAFGSNLAGLSRRMASYVDRILKGARPAELPVEQPTLYELVINLKTAKALGLTIPPSLLARADQVID
jgi:ABC-type uncharacterized transport system substrate-binding protein